MFRLTAETVEVPAVVLAKVEKVAAGKEIELGYIGFEVEETGKIADCRHFQVEEVSCPLEVVAIEMQLPVAVSMVVGLGKVHIDLMEGAQMEEHCMVMHLVGL